MQRGQRLQEGRRAVHQPKRIARFPGAPDQTPSGAREEPATRSGMKMQPQTFDSGRFEIVERGVERGRRDLMRLDDQCRLPSRDLQIGKRQHVRRRQARREMVHERPHTFVVHRAVVYRDQLVAPHQAEAPPGGSVVCRVQGYALPVTESRRLRHGAERSQAIGPRCEHPPCEPIRRWP